jgi:hypothetical protein
MTNEKKTEFNRYDSIWQHTHAWCVKRIDCLGCDLPGKTATQPISHTSRNMQPPMGLPEKWTNVWSTVYSVIRNQQNEHNERPCGLREGSSVVERQTPNLPVRGSIPLRPANALSINGRSLHSGCSHCGSNPHEATRKGLTGSR